MKYKKIAAVLLSLLLVFVTACSLVISPGTVPSGGDTGGPTQDSQNLVDQAVQQTFQAQTLVARSVQETMAAMVTDTPQFTVTPSLTPQPTLTFTPQIPLVHVTTDTNCRVGPGLVYDIVEGLMVGEQAEVHGVDPDHSFWYIRNDGAPTGFCWVGGLYATVVGNTAALPVLTPPPTPIAAKFNASYVGLETCSGLYAFRFHIKSTGSLTLESIRIVITDNTSATTFTHTLDGFRSYNGCVLGDLNGDLMPGEEGDVANVSPGHLGYDPTGHSITAVITICTGNGLTGTCVNKTLNFTP